MKFNHDVTGALGPQKVAFWKGNGSPYSGNSRLVKYYSIWPDYFQDRLKEMFASHPGGVYHPTIGPGPPKNQLDT